MKIQSLNHHSYISNTQLPPMSDGYYIHVRLRVIIIAESPNGTNGFICYSKLKV